MQEPVYTKRSCPSKDIERDNNSKKSHSALGAHASAGYSPDLAQSTGAKVQDFLTTNEVAAFLRIKERKVYDLVAHKEIPFSRVTGKLLFPRAAIAAWVEQNTEYRNARATFGERPAIVAGSHDPLLDWALRASGSGLAVFFDGSRSGLERLRRGEAVAAGTHLVNSDGAGWNTQAVQQAFALEPVVVLEWAKRRQGLVVPAGNPAKIETLEGVRGRTLIPRQPGSGSQELLAALLDKSKGLADAVNMLDPPARSEADVAQAIASGRADVGVAIEAAARQYRLDFLPLADERYDLVVWRRDYFESALQTLFRFCGTEEFSRRADEFGGYDVSGFGAVHYNGP
jgi:putative molybdopterin biosynthesis protein